MRRILMSLSLNPSLSTLARMRGTLATRPLLMRMCPLRSGDEVTREVFASDVVEIPGDAERWKWLGPIRIGLRARGTGHGKDRSERAREHYTYPAPSVPHRRKRTQSGCGLAGC